MKYLSSKMLGEVALPKKSALQSSAVAMLLAAGVLSITSSASVADESGISFWLPGLYGSLAATPTTPGWSVATIYYHTSVNASGAAAASREFQVGRFSPTVNVNLS